MGMINTVAILGFLAMLAMYFPISSFLRNRKVVVEQSGASIRSKNRKMQGKAGQKTRQRL